MTEFVISAQTLVSLCIGFGGFVFGAWKFWEGRQEDRQESVTKSATGKAEAAAAKAEENEKEILRLRAELPLHYVRREDYVRNQTVIEAKLDALAAKFDGVNCG